MTDRRPLEPDEARRLLERAARLQADAADRRETTALVASASGSGYTLAQLRQSAVQAGIDAAYVDAAAAELRAEAALPPTTLGRRERRLMGLYFGEVADAIVVRREFDAPIADVIGALEEVVAADPNRLTLRERRGDPLEGGVLVFDIWGYGRPTPHGFAREVIWSGIRRLLVSGRALEDGRCELVLRGALTETHRVGLWQGLSVMGLGGLAAGAGAVGLAGAIIGAPIGVAAVAAVAAVGAVGGGAVGRGAYRKLCDRWLGRAESAFEGLLGAVEARAVGGWGRRDADR